MTARTYLSASMTDQEFVRGNTHPGSKMARDVLSSLSASFSRRGRLVSLVDEYGEASNVSGGGEGLGRETMVGKHKEPCSKDQDFASRSFISSHLVYTTFPAS
jgi:hypothetical protein